MIHEQEFNEWKEHPVTKALMELLQAKRENLRQLWEGGSFTDYEKDGTIFTNVGNLGTCKGYAFVTDLEYIDFSTETADGKQKRIEAPRGGSTDQSV